ncbi:MAG: hypothetical protein WBR18_07500 [Anaerolineales bacterium]
MYTSTGKQQAQSALTSAMRAIVNRLPWVTLAVFASAAAAGLPLKAAEAHVAQPEMGYGGAAAEPIDGSTSTVFEPFDGASLAAVAEDEPGGLAASDAEMLDSAGLSGAWKPFDTAELAGAAEPFDSADGSSAFEPFDGAALGLMVEGPGGASWSSVRVIDGGGASTRITLYWAGPNGAIYPHLMAAGTLQ